MRSGGAGKGFCLCPVCQPAQRVLSEAGAHGEHPQPRTEGQSGALRSCSLSLHYHSKLLQLVNSKVGFLQYDYQEMWEPGLAAPVCVFAGGINAVSMWIFMSCCRNWGRRSFKKYQSPTPAIYLYAFCFLLHFLVYFCFNKARRISPCSQSQRSCP